MQSKTDLQPCESSKPLNKTKLSQWYDPLDVDAFFDLVDTLEGQERLEMIKIGCRSDPLVLAKVIWPTWTFSERLHRVYVENAVYNKRSLTLGPRGSAKSTVVVTLLAVWALINDRNITMCVISQSGDASVEFLEEVKDILEDEVIVLLFGEFKSQVWTQKKIKVAGRTKKGKMASLAAYGWGSKTFTGKHFDIVFGDDMVTTEHHDSAHLRKKFSRWMGMVLGGVAESESVEIFAGTRYHPDDYYAEMMELGYAINPKHTREIVDWDGIDGDLNRITRSDLLWPEKYTVEFIKERALKRYEFQLQFLNRVDGLDGVIFRRAWFNHPRFDNLPKMHVVIGVDTAYKQATKNDYSAIVALGKLPTGQFMVLEAIRGKWSSIELKNQVKSMYQRRAARKIIVEEFKKNRAENANRTFLVQELRYMNLPVQVISPNKDKVVRYWDMSPLYESGQFWHNHGLRVLEDEMISLPNSEHDDLADALWLAYNDFVRPTQLYGEVNL